MELNTHPHLVLGLRMNRSIPPVPICLHSMQTDFTSTLILHQVPNDLNLSSTLQWEYQISELNCIAFSFIWQISFLTLCLLIILIWPPQAMVHMHGSKWQMICQMKTRTLYFVVTISTITNITYYQSSTINNAQCARYGTVNVCVTCYVKSYWAWNTLLVWDMTKNYYFIASVTNMH